MNKLSMMLKPQRLHGETYPQYVARRKEGNAAVKKFLKGRLIWAASKIVTIKLNAKGIMIMPGVTGDEAVVDRELKIKKKVDGTYEMHKHGPIGTPRKRSKKSWGMQRQPA